LHLAPTTRVVVAEELATALVVRFLLAFLALVGMAGLPVRAMSGLTATDTAKAVAVARYVTRMMFTEAALAELANPEEPQLPEAVGSRSRRLRRLVEQVLVARAEHNFLQPLSTAQTARMAA
jgi:hypothetical protein